MRTMSSSGHAAPNLKSINVECNLLEAWLAERVTLQRSMGRRLGLFWGGVLIFVATTPALAMSLRDQLFRERAEAHAQLSLEAEKKLWDARRKAVDPEVAGRTMNSDCLGKHANFLGWTIDTLNLASPQLVVESCRTEVLSGELTFRVRGQARSADAAQSYVEAAGKDPRVASALLVSSHSSAVLGSKGVAFEFVRKVGLKP